MIRSYLCLTLCAAALITSCQNNQKNGETSLKESKSMKPTVMVVPVIDNSSHQLAWNLSDELTYTLCNRIEQRNKLNIIDPHTAKIASKRLKAHNHPFSNDLSWVSSVFPNQDFVVFLELLEHDEALNTSKKTATPESCSAQLKTTVRVRVIDTRAEQPRVALQEIVHDEHFIPRQFTHYNFHQVSWDSEEFGISPVGIAHAQLIKDLSTRIEDYILLAKTRA